LFFFHGNTILPVLFFFLSNMNNDTVPITPKHHLPFARTMIRGALPDLHYFGHLYAKEWNTYTPEQRKRATKNLSVMVHKFPQDVNSIDQLGFTPLMQAYYGGGGDNDIVRLFIAFGTDPSYNPCGFGSPFE